MAWLSHCRFLTSLLIRFITSLLKCKGRTAGSVVVAAWLLIQTPEVRLLIVGSTLLLQHQSGWSTGRADCDLVEIVLLSVTEMYRDGERRGRAAQVWRFPPGLCSSQLGCKAEVEPWGKPLCAECCTSPPAYGLVFLFCFSWDLNSFTIEI